jgi:tyrosinase
MIVGKRYPSETLELPEVESGEVSGDDLIFYGVDHSWRSYVADVFLGPEPVDSSTPATAEAGHAASFAIFGHGGCFGGEGHCDIVERPADAFDIRPPHPLEGATITVDVSEALARLTGPTFVVTVIPVVPGSEEHEEPEGERDLLRIENVRLRVHGA